uniref:Uncharacterized protein n=1 Tax=Timema cristinae TaxID=61476 RepID=A0A7R9D225_TIMCR|nr:unnamed protein product [Timema cristinae]
MKEVRFLPAIVVWHDDSTYEYLSLQQDDKQTSSDVPSKPIDLEKLFTPASDSGEITPARNRKMYSSSSFYSSNLHPTLEDQVDLARKISHSLSDISNQQSKGQSMYVNRKKKSVKWIHEVQDVLSGEGKKACGCTMATRVGWIPCIGAPPPPGAATYLPKKRSSFSDGTGTREIGDGSEAPGDKMSFKIPNIGPQEVKFRESSKPILKLVMDPRGQVQDLNSLRKQGYSIEPGAVSPEVVFDLVRDLNSPRGKGAELFAKRRKKSEKWVVDENTIRQTTSSSITTSEHLYSSSSTSLQRQLSGTTGSRQSAPVPTYHPDYTKRAEHTQKLMEIQERFSQPRIKMVKSPWEAALETGSVDTAFQELPPLINPTPNPPAWSSSSYSASTYETQNYSSAPETFTPAPLPSVQAYNPPAGVTAPRKPQYIPGGGKDFLYQAKPPRGWGIGQPQQQPTPGFKELNLSSSASTAANSLAEDFQTLASRPISSPSTFPVYIPFTPTSAQPQSSASGKVTSSTTQISVQKNVSFSATQQATTPEQPKSTFQASRQPITTQTPNRTLIQQTPKQTFPSNSVQKPDQSQIKHVITPNTAKPPAGKITAPQVPLEQTQPITQLESKLQEIANSAAAVDRVLSKETVSEVLLQETKTDTQKIDQVNESVIKDGVDKILQGETEGVSQRMEEVNVQNILVSEQENKFSEIIESEQEILTQSYSQDEVKQECVSISNLGKTQAVEIKQEQPISSQVPQSEVENIEPPLLAEKSQPVQNKPDPTKPLPPSEVQQVIPNKPLPISKIPIVSTPTPFSKLSTKQYGHVSPSRDQPNQQPTFQNTHTGVSFTEVFKNDDIKETVNLLIEPQPANQGMQRDHQTETKKVQKSSSSFQQNKVHPNITEQITKINQNQQTLQNVTQTKFSKQQEFTQIIQQQENVVYESRPAVKSIIQNFEQSTRPPMKYKQIQQQSSIEEFMKQATSQQPPSDNPIYYVSNAKVETRTFLPSQEQISQSQTIEQHQQVSSTIQHFQKTEQTQWQSQSSSLITSSSQTQSSSTSSAANQQLQAGKT